MYMLIQTLNLATYSAFIYLECMRKYQLTLNLSVITIQSSWSVYSYMSNITCQIYSFIHLIDHSLRHSSAK